MATTDPRIRARVPEAIEQKLARGARQSERAMIVGNRAGVVEWANDAWTRVTGYALDESVDKPVAGFLEHVDIEPGVIDFVAGCFRSGRVCELEIPLRPPTRDEIWIQLRVEPLFDARGEVSDFIATATDVTERKNAERSAHLSEVDLSALASRVIFRHRGDLSPTAEFDVELDQGLPLVLADVAKVEGLLARRLVHGVESIGDGWGTITVWTGILGSSGGPLFSGNLWCGLPPGQWVFLEVHDTGGGSSGAATNPVSEPFLTTRRPGHALRYAEAQQWMREQGGELRMESAIYDGTSVVLLFPYAAEDSGWQDE
jgi:PAS domain S-box-containing protein